MARVALDDFADQEIARVYLAARLAEALLVEFELDKHNIDYAVEAYLAGAAFYVAAAQTDFCDEILRAAGLKSGLLDKEFQ